MVFLLYWWASSWYIMLFLPFFFLFNIKYWGGAIAMINSFSLENYYFYFFVLKIVQQYHLFLKISYLVFFIILFCYIIKIWQLNNFYRNVQINNKVLYWFNLFFYLYVFIGIVWTFVEPSWVNWWLNENIEELMLCIIFFYFIGFTHFCHLYYKLWLMGVVYLFCLFYWVEQHNTFFNSRHLKLLFYLNIINITAVMAYKKFFLFFSYSALNNNYFYNLWRFVNYAFVSLKTKFKTLLTQKKLNYYFYLLSIILYFNILIFIIPTFLNFWQINFMLDSYYYDIVYLWLLVYIINYNFFKFEGVFVLLDCIFLLSIFNKLNLKDLIHIIFFFTLLINFSLVYWDSYVVLLLSEKLNFSLLYFKKEFIENFFVIKSSLFLKSAFIKIKYMQILEYLFILWFINLFIIKYGARGLSVIAVLSEKLTVRFLWQRASLAPVHIHLALLVLSWFCSIGKFLFYIFI